MSRLAEGIITKCSPHMFKWFNINFLLLFKKFRFKEKLYARIHKHEHEHAYRKRVTYARTNNHFVFYTFVWYALQQFLYVCVCCRRFRFCFTFENWNMINVDVKDNCTIAINHCCSVSHLSGHYKCIMENHFCVHLLFILR